MALSTRRPMRSLDAPARTDPELLAAVATGQLDALGVLYDRHHIALRRFLARATGDAEDVDDLLHTTFLEAAKIADRHDGRANARPWLIGIAVQHLKRRRTALGRFFEVLASFGGTRSAAVDPRATLSARSDLEHALARLSEAKRITFLLAEAEELSCAEIAALLEVPIGTVWTRLHAARRELGALLAEEREP